MTARRLLKAAEAIREVVSMAILTNVRDPRVKGVTVTRVEVAPDMRSATVHVSVMGDSVRQGLALKGLASSAGFLQAKIAEGIETRYTPRLRFELDAGVRHSGEIARMLRELLPAEPSPEDACEEDRTAEESPEAAPDSRGHGDS
ncbi:MAG: 30S ribosome-binding factor RbfA [Planctomycetaceae bacterium]